MAEVVFAPDGLSLEAAAELCRRIKGSPFGSSLGCLKIHDLYDRHGPFAVETLARIVSKVWVDAKLKDVPKTVGFRAQAIKDAGASILTVHASGEIDMMMAAKKSGLRIYAITALTSLDAPQVELAHSHSPLATVLYFARLAKLAEMDGIVCSALEVGYLAKRVELRGMDLVVPGTRSLGVDIADQSRSDTPGIAVKAGATQLVVASEVTAAFDQIVAFGNFVRQTKEFN